MSDLFRLAKKVAIITGSTRGLGRCIAEEFLAAGASVVVSSEDASACEQIEAELASKWPSRILAICCDVRDDNQQRELVEAATTRFGGLDILIANAGIVDEHRGSISGSRATFVTVRSGRMDCSISIA
jgi:NAD(P)-dependent dehydrogenase (short-subunit alcohol dehydrogenase family)